MSTDTNRPEANDPGDAKPANASREQQLERLIDAALRDQPMRRAPSHLQGQVFAEIFRRERAPWWRNSFSYWPVATRALFLIASIGFVKLALDAATSIVAPLNPAARGAALLAEVSWVRALFSTLDTTVHSLPPLWLYGGICVLLALYLLLFGASAVAYRTLYASR